MMNNWQAFALISSLEESLRDNPNAEDRRIRARPISSWLSTAASGLKIMKLMQRQARSFYLRL